MTGDMKTATHNLEQDHINILRLIDLIERMIIDKSTNIEHFETIVYLIKNYADSFHHAKEENLLFPLMVQKGFSAQHGPVAVMLHEHVQGRIYVNGISEGITLLKEGKAKAISTIYENCKGYINLLRSHIEKENNILFRMADKVLTECEHQELLNAFAKVEKNNFSGELMQEFDSAIDKLESNYIIMK